MSGASGVSEGVAGGGRVQDVALPGLPTMAVNDLLVHPRDNDLVLATHSRGIWILDNVNAIQELTPAVLASDFHLFTIEPAEQIRYAEEKAHTGDMFFRGANPAEGALIDYWLARDRDSASVAISIADAAGNEIATVMPGLRAGVNRVVWDLRHERLAARPGSRAGTRGAAGPFVVPGNYTVRLTVDGRALTRPLEVREDPRLDVPRAVRVAWTEALLRIAALQRDAAQLLERLQPVARRLPPRRESGGPPTASSRQPPVTPDGGWLSGRQETQARQVVDLAEELFARLGSLYDEVEGWTGALTADQQSQIDYYARMLGEVGRRAEGVPGRL
jgi:hypothetical protein